MKKLFCIGLALLLSMGMLSACETDVVCETDTVRKPVIYLYPTAPTRVNVTLDYAGTLTSTYPAYPSDGWCVDAQPDGTLTDPATGREYYCLF